MSNNSRKQTIRKNFNNERGRKLPEPEKLKAPNTVPRKEPSKK